MSSLITLIGYRGTGKTSVGKLLAQQLGFDFVDSDQEIESQAGITIQNIFAKQGEPSFRELEQKVIKELLQRQKTVLATGGGAIVNPETRNKLKQSPCVVWLTANTDTIVQRISTDAASSTQRPALTKLAERDEIEHVLKTRTPFYKECANITIETSEKSCEQIVQAIVSQLEMGDLP